MSDNPNVANKSSKAQIPAVQPFNNNALGLSPFYPSEEVEAGFSKVFGYTFAFDYDSAIWRPVGTDDAGNLKVSPGTQGTLSPVSTIYDVDDTDIVILEPNSNRTYFTVYNSDPNANVPAVGVTIHYPNPTSDAGFFLPPGFLLTENTWSGQVKATAIISGVTMRVIVIEYY